MKYDIYVTRYNHEEANYASYGVEIQPSLGELAASGVCQVLTRTPPEHEANDEQEYKAAIMTRNDIKGTALVVYPNPKLKYTNELVAHHIGHAIDPAERHEIVPHFQ